jgi:hypothetical protein
MRRSTPCASGGPQYGFTQVRESRRLLLELADRLGSDGYLGVQGLAMTSMLVGDGVSPLYSKAASRPLKASVDRALLALDRGWTSR